MDELNEDTPPRPPDGGEEENHAFLRLVDFLKQRAAVIGPRPEGPVFSMPPTPQTPPSPDTADTVEMGAAASPFSLPPNFRSHLLEAYRQRREAAPSTDVLSDSAPTANGLPPAAPLPAPANNWIPRGPSVLRRGQASNRPAVSGRLPGVAVARGGERVYVASANGGVWRSDDGGLSWYSTMETWDLNPTTGQSDSLACGAIAIDLEDPDRVYVGTGEGDTVFIDGGQVIGTSAYFGVGPIRSDDGGGAWHTERYAAGSETNAGSAFYALAVDPGDRERVVGATIHGLYTREPDGAGGHHWVRKMTDIFTSVVAARGDAGTVFYAARWGGAVYASPNGDVWDVAGTGFPTAGVGRVGLAVQPTNPSVVYYLAERRSNHGTLGVWRFDADSGRWRVVSGHPANLLGNQGSYDLAIAVDPENVNLIYLGGSTSAQGGEWSASLYRARVTAAQSSGATSYSMQHAYVGANIHSDVHALQFTPGDPSSLWVACDGGLFFSPNAQGAARFEQRNVGLATLMMNQLGLHPTEEALAFCGTQDNGTVRYTGEEAWLHSGSGDGGFVVVNWHDPYRILRTYVRGEMEGADDGGQGYGSWHDRSLPTDMGRAKFYAPLVGTPYNPSAPAEADLVAFGGWRPWISHDFGSTWASIPDDNRDDEFDFEITALEFASARRLYVGTGAGEVVDANGQVVFAGGDVYSFAETNGRWAGTLVSADPLPVGPITSIAVDPEDASGDSIYVTLGGLGDYRHVWRFDGATWEERSGPAADSDDSLIDVQHNAIAVDPANPGHLYVAADIGVWRSTDRGLTWSPFVDGLPDAAVLDLKIFNPRRVLLASTHGRGVFERTLDTDTALGTELYVRDTQLDLRRAAAAYGAHDPTRFGRTISPGNTPDIKVDAPSPQGRYQTPTSSINFFEFVDVITDQSDAVIALDAGSGPVVNRVFVQVHNRGLVGDDVLVMLVLASASGGVPTLPAGYDSAVRNGAAINTPPWVTVGTEVVRDVRACLPRVASFDLSSSMLLPPTAAGGGDYVLLALLHSARDRFAGGETSVELLSQNERKAAYKKIRTR